jgi:hypothetical protein
MIHDAITVSPTVHEMGRRVLVTHEFKISAEFDVAVPSHITDLEIRGIAPEAQFSNIAVRRIEGETLVSVDAELLGFIYQHDTSLWAFLFKILKPGHYRFLADVKIQTKE